MNMSSQQKQSNDRDLDANDENETSTAAFQQSDTFENNNDSSALFEDILETVGSLGLAQLFLLLSSVLGDICVCFSFSFFIFEGASPGYNCVLVPENSTYIEGNANVTENGCPDTEYDCVNVTYGQTFTSIVTEVRNVLSYQHGNGKPIWNFQAVFMKRSKFDQTINRVNNCQSSDSIHLSIQLNALLYSIMEVVGIVELPGLY